MIPETCQNCGEIKKLYFQIKDTDVQIRSQKLEIEAVQQRQDAKDIEHEQMIQNITTRMDTMSSDFINMSSDFIYFKKEVKEDIQSIKNEIPDMFNNAINKLMAKILKVVAGGVLIVICVIVLAFSRPVILKGIDEFRNWVETVEVTK